jgi:hypothetical protein
VLSPSALQPLCLKRCFCHQGAGFFLRFRDRRFIESLPFTRTGLAGIPFEYLPLLPGVFQDLLGSLSGSGDLTGHFPFCLPDLIEGGKLHYCRSFRHLF